MVFMAIAALVCGVLASYFFPDLALLNTVTDMSGMVLYMLMFIVGISVGMNKDIVSKIKSYGFKIFLIPIGIMAGSFVGGVVCALLTSLKINEGAAIASGMGWYSLSGVMLGEMAGADMGSIAFLSNLLREIMSFALIPIIAKRLNGLTCIAPAGATSEDTTLPMMIRYTDEPTVVLSLMNGILCSAAVPFMIEFCYKILPNIL